MTTILNPGTYSPVNSEIWIITDSTLSNQTNFKYLYKINEVDKQTNSETLLGTFEVPPRPITAYGQFTPAKLLRSQVSYNIQPFITNILPATNSIVKYNYTPGYQYNPNGVISSVVDSSGNAMLVLGTGSHVDGAQIFDQIYIRMDNAQVNEDYNGLHEINDVQYSGDNQYIEIDALFATSSITETGQVTLLRHYESTSDYFYAYNGTRQYDQIDVNFSDTNVFYPDASTASALTNYRSGTYLTGTSSTSKQSYADLCAFSKNIFINNYETTTAIFDDNSALLDVIVRLKTFDSDGNVLNVYTIPNTYGNTYSKVFDIPTGPQNLIDAGIIGSFSSVSYYNIEITDFELVGFTSIFYNKWYCSYKIVDNCSPYDNVRIMFQNRLGGFDYYNFNWKSTNTINVARNEFKKILQYNYNVGDRQDTVLSSKVNETNYISTDWISQYDAEYLKELISSPEVYVIDEVNQKYYPIIITDNSYTVKTYLNNKMFSISLNFKYAYDIKVQQS